jgi:hypothetical protein
VSSSVSAETVVTVSGRLMPFFGPELHGRLLRARDLQQVVSPRPIGSRDDRLDARIVER